MLINGFSVIVVNQQRANGAELEGLTSTAALVKDRGIRSYKP